MMASNERQPIDEEELNLFTEKISTHDHITKDYGKRIEDKIINFPFLHMGDLSLSFKNCLFKERFTLINYSPTANIYFTDCDFEKDISFKNVKTDKRISFLNCMIQNKLLFIDAYINNLDLNNKTCQYLSFNDGCSFNIAQIGGRDRNIIGVIFISAYNIKNRFSIDNTDITHCNISYSTLDKELSISNCSINQLDIQNFRNDGELKFLNCKCLKDNSYVSEILIKNSNLGKAEFHNVDFASFPITNIVNSAILECLYMNSKWGKNVVSVDLTSTVLLTPKSFFKQRAYASKIREVYKQIKLAMSKQGSNIEEQYFHGLEMNAYNRSLSYRTDFWIKIILKLSFWTSNYGQSLLRPLLLLFVVNGLLFSFINLINGYHFAGLNKITFHNIFETVGSFLWFLNPIHRNEPELKGLSLIIDIVIRIISSYCIYNIVRASRRFIG